MYNFVTFTILAFFILASLSLSFAGKIHPIASVFVLCSACGVFFLFRHLRRTLRQSFASELDKMDEGVNLLSRDIEEKKKILDIIPAKCEKISFLFNASEKLIGLGEPEEVFDYLVNTSSELFPQADNILLLLLERDTLRLTRSVKHKNLVIKDKYGDIIDKWILRNNQSLLIEDFTQEYRFDCKKTAAFKERQIQSLISSPLSIGERIMGVMRVESKASRIFSLDDSRLLRSICDLGVVVLERANLMRRMEELAIKDPLTGLFLRDHFFSRLNNEAKRDAIKQTGLGMIMLDIDDFKKINDTYGHVVGDIVLRRIAKILKETLGEAGNCICRFGGEEFVAMVVEANKEKILTMAEAIRKNAQDTAVSFRRKDVCFTVSLGVAFHPDDGIEISNLVDEADRLLYKAKREGKNRICYIGQ
ncbi:MAG: sensor domain-containing diguanylate cyclase [Candidatus Omnitrophica bacterium]|nr:sensor domain-containing diguanylate cyclase [Candidatus Omnitrophota bacterium]